MLQDRNILLDNPAGKLKRARPVNDPARQLLSGTKLKALGLQHPAPDRHKCGPALTCRCSACSIMHSSCMIHDTILNSSRHSLASLMHLLMGHAKRLPVCELLLIHVHRYTYHSRCYLAAFLRHSKYKCKAWLQV